MANLTSTQIGSVVLNLIDGVPSNLSGTTLTFIVDSNRNFMQDELGVTIASTAIADKYQPALVSLTASEVTSAMQAIGVDSNNIKLGELSISTGGGAGGSNLSRLSSYYKDKAEMQLNALGISAVHFRSLS